MYICVCIVCIYMCVYIYICEYVCLCVYMYVCVRVCTCVCVCARPEQELVRIQRHWPVSVIDLVYLGLESQIVF